MKRNKTPAKNLTFLEYRFRCRVTEKKKKNTRDLCKPMNQSICFVFVESDLI